jgi:RecA/RadA recombinase
MIINIFGGPGTGKSTLALGLGFELKKQGFEAAVIIEEAKPYALAEDSIDAPTQLKIMAAQHANESKYYGLADFIITDSPLELQGFYYWLRTGSNIYRELVAGLRMYCTEERRNFLLVRSHAHSQRGRFQTEEQAKHLDPKLAIWLKYLHPTLTNIFDPKLFIERYGLL